MKQSYILTRNTQKKKIIMLLDVGFHSITLLLGLQKESLAKIKTKNVTGRQLRVFTAFLYNYKNWQRFSREQNKLFVVEEAVKEVDNMIAKDILRQAIGTQLYSNIDWNRWMLPKVIIDLPARYDINMLVDTDMPKILEYLISMKDVGDETIRLNKRVTLDEIKKLLIPWM